MKSKKIYKSPSTIPVFNFFKIVDSNDFRFLLKKFDFEDDSDFKLDNTKIKEFEGIFNEIVFEYLDILDNKKLVQNYKTKIVISNLEKKYRLGIKFLDIYIKYGYMECLEGLELLKYNIKGDNIIESIQHQILGLITKIKIKKIKYTERFLRNKDNSKINLEQEAIKLEKILDLKYSIDIRITTLSKWVSLINLSKAQQNG